MSENTRVKYYCADRESSSKCHTFCIDVFNGEGNQAPHLFAIIGHRETAEKANDACCALRTMLSEYLGIPASAMEGVDQ